MKVIWV